MSDPFVHLHVASGYSLRYGASAPGVLVERAAEYGMDTLALTDRDGLYGAVRFATACLAAGIRPLFGVDLAVIPPPADPANPAALAAGRVGRDVPADVGPDRYQPAQLSGGAAAGQRSPAAGQRSPARGGAFVDPRWPRATFLARDRLGWAALCRLVSATHLAGERGRPVTTLDLVVETVTRYGGGVFVLLGPDSDVGRALARRRPDLARAALDRWRQAIGDGVVIEVVHHRAAGDMARGGRLLGFAAETGTTAVLTNAVRAADRADGPTLDVLDATRRLVTLDARHVDRPNAEGFLKSGKEMALLAEEVARAAGLADGGRGLLAQTRRLADRCVVDPRADLGIGSVHFPELGVLGLADRSPDVVLRERCEAGLGRRGVPRSAAALDRLDDELSVIATLGYPAYFLTVADVVDLIAGMGVRCAARGSGAGSLVAYLLGISGVDPLEHGLLMERFLSPLRRALPDIDLDVESARRTDVYERILDRYGGARCACVSMMDTYRARHAIRDVGAALGLPPGEVDALAKAFPHIRASQVRAALRDLPELRASGLDPTRLDVVLRLVERLDGLPRHIAVHPCGVLLSDASLLDRTPVEASWLGFPMSQFDKDDVEELGLLKLDVLGVRMQSAMAHAVAEVERVDGARIELDAVPRDDPATFALICSTRTLGCFQIESPGQRELVGKFGPETFADLIIDISLFRPGPVKSDMVRPFLEARQGWTDPDYLHPGLVPALAETYGVVVFHEQVLRIVSTMTNCSLAQADEVRRALGDPVGQPEVRVWFFPAALGAGYPLAVVERVWTVLEAFGSFGFCKAHAAAFALPTYQSAWLKAHHAAAFLAGVLTHDPGMYPKRLILDDARQFGIAILPLDVNVSDHTYRVERVGVLDEPPPGILGAPPRPRPTLAPDARRYGIRLSLADVKGISAAEVDTIVAGRPYAALADFWQRAGVSRPVAERLVVAGGFDAIYGIGLTTPVRRRGQLTRRDLLLQVAEFDAATRAASRARSGSSRLVSAVQRPGDADGQVAAADIRTQGAAADIRTQAAEGDVRAQAARQSQAPAPVRRRPVQLAFDLGDDPGHGRPSGLPEMTDVERVRAELEVLGLDASRHILDFYRPLLRALGTTRARDLLGCRSQTQLYVAGVKVATQTPPVRSGRRVVFVTLDDATGPVDATFFEAAQAGCAATLFHSWLLVISGQLRRTGPRGVSLLATGAWELPALWAAWRGGGLVDVRAAMRRSVATVTERAVHEAAASRSTRPVLASPPVAQLTGAQISPYADVAPAGDRGGAPRRLWHASQGSAGG